MKPIGRFKNNSRGFSHVEGFILLVVVVAIAGVGVYVYHHDHKSTATNANLAATTSQSTSQITAIPTGTTSGVAQITKQDEQAEANAYSTQDSQTKQNTQSPNSALINMEGAYNASSL